MKTTSAWLNSFFENDRSAEELADILTMAGTEVEHRSPADVASEGDVMQLEVTSNRVDCLGVHGLVREIAAVVAEEAKFSYPATIKSEGQGPSVVISPDAEKACPYYSARLIKNVKVGPSPDWLRDRLESIGVASINNIVDVTNYVLMEYSQPLHAFDADKLKGGIQVRMAEDGEVFNAINHRAYKLGTQDLVIADDAGVQALAGVMGGSESEISNATTSVLLESAYFEPKGVKATGRRMDGEHSENLDSDSRYRFERGVDPMGAEVASARAIELILELAGGELVGPLASAGSLGDEWLRELTLRFQSIERTMGAQVGADRVAQILSSLGLRIDSQDDESVRVSIPSFRRDLEREIDLVEEIGRVVGLDQFESRLVLPISKARPTQELEDRPIAAEILRGLGLSEAVTDTFVSDKGNASLTPWESGPALRARSPINTHWPCIRRSLMPSLARIYGENLAKSSREVSLFEIATLTLTPKSGEAKPQHKGVVAMIGPDFFTLKGAVEQMLARMGVSGLEWKSSDFALFEAGEGSAIHWQGELLGYLGRLSAAAAKETSMAKAATVAELDFSKIVERRERVPMFAPIARFPVANRDLAVVVDDGQRWADIEAAVRSVGAEHLKELHFFDEFRGKQVPKGKKSLAFAMTFRDDTRTLVSEEVDTQMAAIIAALQTKCSAEVRS